jgi:hypothetical protein
MDAISTAVRMKCQKFSFSRQSSFSRKIWFRTDSWNGKFVGFFFSILDVTTGFLGLRSGAPSYNITRKCQHTREQNETTAFRGKDPARIKIIINCQALSEVYYFTFPGNDLRFDHHNDMKNKVHISKIRVEQTQKHPTRILWGKTVLTLLDS